ncbi:MAG: DUF2275 domain-containing protein [Geobacter sp.]|nr:MAG: DUF2275 domain-containing protein [Geobacter sp.]
MDHDSIRHMLSEYLDGAVTPAEKLLIETHLKECCDCRNALRELEKTIHHVRNLGEVEPPPWLAVKVMARVREEAGRKKGVLRRLLLVPLRWRVSVEAVALVFLSVTGYLVYQNVSSEMKQIVPLSGVIREESAPSVPPPAESPKVPEARAPQVKRPPAATEGKQGAGPAPLTLPEEPFSDSRQEEFEPLLPSPAESPLMAEDRGMDDYRMQERSSAKSASPPAELSFPEKEQRAPSGIVRKKALPSTGVEVLRLEIIVADADSAQRKIEREAARYGGIIVRKDAHLAGERGLVVQLQRKAVHGFIEQLKQLGSVRGAVSEAPEGTPVVEMYLAVTTGQE